MLMLGVPQPQPSSATDNFVATPDPAITTFLLAILFIVPMFVLFTYGLGHLIDWYRIRGWDMKQETPKQRRLRYEVLGDKTARCEKCLADCRNSVGLWVIDGKCEKCRRLGD